jgi:hypothetical protein
VRDLASAELGQPDSRIKSKTLELGRHKVDSSSKALLIYWVGPVDGLAEAHSGLNIPAQIRDHNLLIHNSVWFGPSAVGRQGNVNDAIREPKRGGSFVKDERSMRGVANRDYRHFLGTRCCMPGRLLSLVGMKRRIKMLRGLEEFSQQPGSAQRPQHLN